MHRDLLLALQLAILIKILLSVLRAVAILSVAPSNLPGLLRLAIAFQLCLPFRLMHTTCT